jgi:hypothetical protein
MLRELPRVLVVDTLGEYELPWFDSIEGAAAWFAAQRPDRFRIAMRVPSEDVDRLLKWAWAIRPVIVLVEETDLYAPPNSVIEGLKWWVEYGRQYELGLIAVTRRPYLIDRRLTANARYVVLFPTQEPRDRAYWTDLLPQQVVVSTFSHLDVSTEPGEYAAVDMVSRTVALVSRDGKPARAAEPKAGDGG